MVVCLFCPVDVLPRVTPERKNREYFAALLRKCGNSRNLEAGKRVHASIVAIDHLHRSVYLANLAIEMFGKCGDVDRALEIFHGLARPNVYSWNIALAALLQNAHLDSAKEFFASMEERDVVSWNTLLAALAEDPARLSEASELFAWMEGIGSTSSASFVVMISAFARSGDVSSARNLFDRMKNRDTVVWTAMISCYAHNSLLDQAYDLFRKMTQRNSVSWNVMIAALARKGQMVEARKLFSQMPAKDVVAWTSIVTGHGQNGQSNKAISAFLSMDLEGVEANELTFVSFLDACASVAAAAQGRALLSEIRHRPAVWSNVIVRNAAVNFYGKCGEIEQAREVFDGTSPTSRTVVSWTAMATAYAHNGVGPEAVELFRAMVLEGLAPDDVSIVGMLYACNHAGMIDAGWQCFAGIEQDYALAPAAAHYVCLVDLLGRTGRLREAEEVIHAVAALEADAVAWNTLLAACRVHRERDRGKRAAERVLALDPGAVGSYIHLSKLVDGSRRRCDRGA